MHKRLIAGLGALALVSALLIGTSTKAESKVNTKGLEKFVAKDTLALDTKGDAKGIGAFQRYAEDNAYAFVKGKVTVVSASSITVNVKHHTDDGTDTVVTSNYTFSIDAKTKIIRKFKGTATVSEIDVGDTVSVWASDLTNGHARLIWDQSIWAMQVKGTVANLDTTNKTFQLVLKTTQNRGITKTSVANIHVSDTTVYTKDGVTKSFSDIANGQTLTVRGSWNNPDNFILAKGVTIQ